VRAPQADGVDEGGVDGEEGGEAKEDESSEPLIFVSSVAVVSSAVGAVAVDGAVEHATAMSPKNTQEATLFDSKKKDEEEEAVEEAQPFTPQCLA
jgi:hypothetical protein